MTKRLIYIFFNTYLQAGKPSWVMNDAHLAHQFWGHNAQYNVSERVRYLNGKVAGVDDYHWEEMEGAGSGDGENGKTKTTEFKKIGKIDYWHEDEYNTEVVMDESGDSFT